MGMRGIGCKNLNWEEAGIDHIWDMIKFNPI